MNPIFQNHETVKLGLHSPLVASLVIFGGLLALILLTTRRRPADSFLGRGTTNQLRGIAILLVLSGHLGIHLLNEEARPFFPVLGAYGVSLFFALSGFGLTMSASKKPFIFKEFIRRRLMKVMLPYWIITLIILVADHFLLDKNYGTADIILTFLGANINEATRNIDYVRWYITVLLIWYCVFALFAGCGIDKRATAWAMVLTGTALIMFSYYVHPLGYGYLSFPFGVIVALYHRSLGRIPEKISTRKIWILSLCSCIFLFFLKNSLLAALEGKIPSIVIQFATELSLLLFSLTAIIVANLLRTQKSGFLTISGDISYALFLLHMIFMLKYDFFLFRWDLSVSFWAYLIFLFALSRLAERFFGIISRPGSPQPRATD